MDPGSLNIENIENLLGSMSADDIEQLKETASALFSSMGQQKSGEEKEKKKASGSSGNSDFDFETVTKIMSLMEKLKNQPEDPRCIFLRSLKPMLSSERRKKVDQAINMISVLSFLPLIQELGGK